jgi:uncharacterized protein (TIGR03067 family)
MLFLLTAYVPPIAQIYSNFNMKVPVVAEWAIATGRWVVAGGNLALAVIVICAILDAVVLRTLDHPSGRLKREVWSSLALGLPVVLLVYTAYVLTIPAAKLMEAMLRANEAHDKASLAEEQCLEGTWKLIGVEREGKALAAAEVPDVVLTLQGSRFTWIRDGRESVGSYNPMLRTNPKQMSIMHAVGNNAGNYQVSVYKLEGDKLTMCIAPPNTFGDDLPIDFTTRGTRNELLVWQRQK